MPILPPQNPGAQPVQRRQGSGFTNLSRILQANKNNRLGEAVSSGIVGGANQIRQQLGDTRDQFQSQANANDLASDQNKSIRENVLKNIAGGQTDVTDQQADQFKNFRQGQYTGPQEMDMAKTTGLGIRANEVQNQAKNPLSENTLQATVGSQSQNPYSRGQIGLDRTILGAGNPQQLGQARSATMGLSQGINRAQDVARGEAALKTLQAQQFGKDTQAQLAAPQTGIQNDINTAVTTKQGDLSAAIKNYNLDPNKYLGRTSAQLYGLDPTKYGGVVNFLNPGDINKGTVASQTQLNQLNALGKLAGQPQEFITDPSKVGSLEGKSLSTTDQGLLNQLVSARQGEYQKAIQQPSQDLEQQIRQNMLPLQVGNMDVSNDASGTFASRLNALQQLQSQYGQSQLPTKDLSQDPTGRTYLNNILSYLQKNRDTTSRSNY